MNKSEKPFYIGWQENMPVDNKKYIKRFLLPIFIGLPLLAVVIVYAQKGFNNHLFEFGKITELTGIYHAKPVPILEVDQNNKAKLNSNYVLLVGYAKYGAEGIIKQIEDENESLNGKKITIQGSLIQGDGKTLLELTQEKNSLIKIHSDKRQSAIATEPLDAKIFAGEILDPKCYFGVMKPGEGKIHKSCAIRCISGGIPPIIRVMSDTHKNDYYLILGENGEKINQKILDKVAEQTLISGRHGKLNGWNYIYTNPESIKLLEEAN